MQLCMWFDLRSMSPYIGDAEIVAYGYRMEIHPAISTQRYLSLIRLVNVEYTDRKATN